jgi:hypothetical protein
VSDIGQLWIILALVALIGAGYLVWLLHMQSVIMVMQEDIKKIYREMPVKCEGR